jgi:uncharacterized protein (DUF2267 family)
VEYVEFIDRVAERADVSREHAVTLTHATLQVLADRISGGQDVDLAAPLPEELARLLRKAPQKLPEKYGFDEFVERVRERGASAPREAVLPGVRAALLTLREAVGDKEFRDALDQLPHQFRDLLQYENGAQADEPAADTSGGDQTAGAAASRGQRAGAHGAPAAQEDALVQRTAERIGVSAEDAAGLTQATLEVLGDRIGGQQAHELAQRLPDLSAQWLDEPVDIPAQNYGVEDFVSRVRVLAIDVADDDLTPGIQAVMISLRDAVGDAELEIALEPLSDDYAVLVRVS